MSTFTVVIKSCDNHVIHTTHDDGNMKIMYRSTTNPIWTPPIHHCSIIHSTPHYTNVSSRCCIPQTLILYNRTHLISYNNWSVDEHTTDYTMYIYSQVIVLLLKPLPLYHSNNTHTCNSVCIYTLPTHFRWALTLFFCKPHSFVGSAGRNVKNDLETR